MKITVPVLRAAGCSDALIVRICELAQNEAILDTRTKNRLRKQRSRHAIARDTRDMCDIAPLSTEESLKDSSEGKSLKSRGARLPIDWRPNADDIQFARGLIAEAWHIEADKFRDYWHDKPGADGRKVTWSATWRNWVRRVAEQRKTGNGKANNDRFVSNTLADLWDDRRSKAP
jgi:hypothetical protein